MNSTRLFILAAAVVSLQRRIAGEAARGLPERERQAECMTAVR